MIVGSLLFDEPLNLLKTDTLEWDSKRKKVMVVNSAGKVKQWTYFRVEDNGQETTAGSGQDTRVVGEG